MKILLVVYDNESFIHPFPHGIGYIASILERNGHKVEIYNQDVHHYPEEHLTYYLNTYKFDVVGVSVIAGYYQYAKLLKISEAIKNTSYRPIYIIGGHGPTPEPKYFLEKTQADAIIMGEGEETIIDFLNNINNLKDVKGIAYREGDKITVNERRPLIKNIDNLPIPAYHLLPMEYYRLIRFARVNSTDFVLPMLSGRGCIFKCNFCLSGNTKIKTLNGDKEIREIKEKDKVIGFNEKEQKIDTTTVTNLYQRKGKIYKITLEDNTVLEISEEHPIFTKRGWIEIKNLKESDEVLKYE